MAEILTESFCERCGNRYSFEAARPRARLKGVKVLSRGLKAFVLSDDTSIEEAMALARNEAEREATAQHLEAFHKTFNFCLSCRQYTCPNCWNDVEARCLSCAPLAMPDAPDETAALPLLGERSLTGVAVPRNALTNPDVDTWPVIAEPKVELIAAGEPVAVTEPEILAEAVPVAAGEPVAVTEPEVLLEAVPVAAAEPVALTEPEVPVEPVAEPRDAVVKAAAQTTGLLKRFRPGQNLDAELDAYERERDDEAVTVDLASERARVDAESEAVAATEPEPAPVALAPEEPAPVEAAPVAEATAPIEPAAIETTRVAEASAPIAPIEPAARDLAPAVEPPSDPTPRPQVATADVVEQPTWRITTPDVPVETTPTFPPEVDGPVPLQASEPPIEPPAAAPHWPASPQWPRTASAAALPPFLGRPPAAEGGIEALWAASNQELVTASPAPGRASGGIRPCISCGLSLSAVARFCRRCGALQGA